MKKNIIIIIQAVIIVILIVLLLVSNNGSSKKQEEQEQPKEDPNKEVIGIYYNDKQGKSIKLLENSECYYRDNSHTCEYRKENKKVIFTLTSYRYDADDTNDIHNYTIFTKIEDCKKTLEEDEKLKQVKGIYCKEYKTEQEADILNNGLLVNSIVYNKIG